MSDSEGEFEEEKSDSPHQVTIDALKKCQGVTRAAVYSQKGKKLLQSQGWALDEGEVDGLIRAFKSKSPSVYIGNNNHNITERKSGKTQMLYASCVKYGTNVVAIDTRTVILIAEYPSSFDDKQKRTVHEQIEKVGTDIANKK